MMLNARMLRTGWAAALPAEVSAATAREGRMVEAATLFRHAFGEFH